MLSATTHPATPSSNVRRDRVRRKGHVPLCGVSDRSSRMYAREPNSNARTRRIRRSLEAAPVVRTEGTCRYGDPSSSRSAEPRAGERHTAALVVRTVYKFPVADPCSARRRALAGHPLRSAVGSGPSGRRIRMGVTAPGRAESTRAPRRGRASPLLALWVSTLLADDPGSCRPEVAWR